LQRREFWLKCTLPIALNYPVGASMANLFDQTPICINQAMPASAVYQPMTAIYKSTAGTV
jgi:hypothetical protein